MRRRSSSAGAFFADLVRAHYAWERALNDGTPTPSGSRAAEEYDRQLTQFQQARAAILEAYWCVRRPSAVALTEKPQTRRSGSSASTQIRLHRSATG